MQSQDGYRNELLKLFENSCYLEVISLAATTNISPQSDPYSAHILAASHFKIGNFEAAASLLVDLEASLAKDTNFLSLYAATSRRLGNLKLSENLFLRAIELDPSSLVVKNNYANLLIDLSEYDKAKVMLDSVLASQPDYTDAKENLSRLERIVDSSRVSSSDPSSISNSSVFNDPLLLAFDQKEVDFSLERYISKHSKKTSQPLLTNLPHADNRDVANEQLQVAIKAISEGNAELSLKLCSKVKVILGSDARIYDCASDAYLHLKQYHISEICLLHAYMLGGESAKRLFNLASFASMRSDFALADFYLSKYTSLDLSPSHASQLQKNINKQRAKSTMPYVFYSEWTLPDISKV